MASALPASAGTSRRSPPGRRRGSPRRTPRRRSRSSSGRAGRPRGSGRVLGQLARTRGRPPVARPRAGRRGSGGSRRGRSRPRRRTPSRHGQDAMKTRSPTMSISGRGAVRVRATAPGRRGSMDGVARGLARPRRRAGGWSGGGGSSARARLDRPWVADPGRDADRELARRDVARDDGAGAGLRPVAERDRSTEHRVDAEEDALADLGVVLADAVVVGGDRARPDVRPRADVGVAEVAHVVLLDARLEARVLHLGEVAELDAGPDGVPGAGG